MAGSSTTTASISSLLLLFFLFGFALANNEILVGGKADAWKIPSSEADSLNEWSKRARFQVGDHLIWKYDAGKDSVLLVTEEDYTKCITSKPVKMYNDGNTKVRLDHPGPYYFISGEKGHCENGQKLTVVVITPRGRYTGISPSISPSLAPSPYENLEGPAIAPTSSATTLKAGIVIMALGVLAMWGF